MNISRRNFLKLSGLAALTGTLAAKLGCAPDEPTPTPDPDDPTPVVDDPEELWVQYADTVTQICSYCGVGCGVLCYVEDGKIINVDGDPDHPVSEGTLCSKGSALFEKYYEYDEKGNAIVSPQRMQKVLYRAPKATDWEERDWDWAIEEIARRFKDTRDEYFKETNEAGDTVNRCEALAWIGSAKCNNEENYLYRKFVAATGIVNNDHCARL
ncbi:MAG: twin-arginine translocation signal domain-containing protein [Candidatus Syntrophonatronum acetioxidans]|uniref:Twin-arginine translocation signal domain-containing protein n=1 Tax=Candidatus Syntrophonatronum acetioxidans TaxID=1795816 RepID=A0A424YHL2_9FIRM|nr:MAG: twin-arginine translocation signal domain-containing protein [Candidatus Syntrophonatronum acetioxidans]